MTWMLRLYPRGWRRRYGSEVMALVASEPRSFRLFLDLLAGAIDARLNPQWIPATTSTATKGNDPMISIRRLCASSGFSPADRKRSSAWLIGGSLGLVLLSLVLKLGFDLTVVSQALLFGAFPMGLILSGWDTFLKPYPQPVRWILFAGALTGMLLFMLAVTWLANRY